MHLGSGGLVVVSDQRTDSPVPPVSTSDLPVQGSYLHESLFSASRFVDAVLYTQGGWALERKEAKGERTLVQGRKMLYAHH